MLFRLSIRHPKLTLAVATLITLAIAPGVRHLEIRTDGHALVPPNAPEILLDAQIRDEFGVEDPIVVLIRSHHESGMFNTETLTLVQDLTREFQNIEGITEANVVSLAVEKGDRVRPGTLIFRRFLEPMPRTEVELQRLRNDLKVIELFNGVLVSADETATAILIGVPTDMGRGDLYRTVRKIVAAKGELPDQVDVIGAPVAEALLGTHLLEDLGVPTVLLGHDLEAGTKSKPWELPRDLEALKEFIGRHIGLVPVALIVMAGVFLLSFRNIPAVVLPLSEVGACLAVVFGLMGLCSVPVYLTIAVLPVILTAIGVADEIHIFARYQELLREHPDGSALDALHATMSEMWRPIVKTSLTTAVGFLSFAMSPINPVRAFGIFTAVGILFCMLWSLTAIPATLALIDAKRLMPRRLAAERGERRSWFGLMGTTVVRFRVGIVVLALLVVAIAPFGVDRVVVQDSWIDGFAQRSAFRRAVEYFNEQFLGVHTLLVRVDAGDSEPITGSVGPTDLGHHEVRIPVDTVDDPETLIGQVLDLKRLGLPGRPNLSETARVVTYTWDTLIEGFKIVEGRPTRGQDGLLVPAKDQIELSTHRKDGSPILALKLQRHETAEFEIRSESFMKPEVLRRIGEFEDFIEQHTEEAVGGVLGTEDYITTTEFMLRGRKAGSRVVPEQRERLPWVWGQFKNVRGESRWRQAVAPDYSKALVSIYMKNANFVDTKRLMDDIRRYEQEHLMPHGMTIEFAGDVAVSQSLIDAIVTTQIRSLIGSLVGILLVTTLLGRSLIWGLLCVLPCAVAVLVNFAVMGVAGMPLGVATSMFSGMTLGIGVDYAIHLMERYRLSRNRGLDLDAAIEDAVRATGPAVFIDAAAVALGFGVMTLSQVPANARLGGLVVLSIVGCFCATLMLLPALIRLFRLRVRRLEAAAPAAPQAVREAPNPDPSQ